MERRAKLFLCYWMAMINNVFSTLVFCGISCSIGCSLDWLWPFVIQGGTTRMRPRYRSHRQFVRPWFKFGENFHCSDIGFDDTMWTKVAHAVRAQLAWHMQNYDLILSLLLTKEKRVFLVRSGIWAHEPFTKWSPVLTFILATIPWVTNEEELGAVIVINVNRSLAPLEKDLSSSVYFDVQVIISFKRYVNISAIAASVYIVINESSRMIYGNKIFRMDHRILGAFCT